ncbi:MAG: protein kinase domain-containing protein, partial [Wenzhouxiangella sp.]
MKKTPRNPDSFDPEAWRQADKVLDALLQIPEAQRNTYLDGLELEPEVKERARRLAEMLEQPGLLDSEDVTWLGKLNALNASGLEGRRFGPYQLQEQIGRGGMSSVYRAVRTDGAYDAAVAFKLLNPALMATDWKNRFQREARFLAELRHPGISCLLDAGVTEDGTPYLVTELIDGLPLDQYCDAHDLNLRERVALVAELCEAVAFAQSRLVVHRDIKADNVLVDQQGRVKLLDFGIARLLDDAGGSTRLTQATYTRIFTPQYAAPEQLAGQPLTTATDVFALGVVLYRLLTGHLPYTREQSVGAGRESLTQPSRKVETDTNLERSRRQRRSAQLRGDLDNILARALAEDPEHRYANAKELGRDLAAWLEHRPVQARRPSLVYRLRLFVRRRRELAAALCALIIVAVGGLSATLWQAGEARVQAASAVAAGARAQAVSEFMLSLFEANDPDLSGNESVTAAELLEAGRLRATEAFKDQPETRAELLLTLARLYEKLGDAEQTRALLESSQVIESGTPLQAARAWSIHSNLARVEGEVQLALEAARAGNALVKEHFPIELQVDLRLALTLALTNSGEIEAGVAAARAALAFVDRHQPAAAHLRLAVLNNLAGTLFRLADYEAALPVAEEAWALAQRGIGSPTLVVSTMGNYAVILTETGRLDDAITLRHQALKLAEDTYPQMHRWRAKTAGALGDLLALMGHFREAELRMNESLALYETIYPEPNLHSGSVYNNLGTMMLDLE